MAGFTHQPLQTTSIAATADLVARRFVTHAGAYAADDALAVGVTDLDCNNGAMATVHIYGIIAVEASAAIAAGAKVSSAANGQAKTAVSGEVLGIALSSASGSGDIIKVLIR